MRVTDLINRSKRRAREREGTTKVADALPSVDQDVFAYCLDHRGIYRLPFKCFHDGEVWVNAETEVEIRVAVFAWKQVE